MTIALNASWSAWWALVIFYSLVFWGLPMFGLLGRGRGPYIVKPRPYWRCVFEVVSIFHISGALSVIFIYAFIIAAKVH